QFRPDKPEVIAVLKKFGVETSVVEAEYYKQYQAKHGVDLKKLEADYQAKFAKALAEYERKHGRKDPYGAVPEAVTRQVGPPPQHDDQELYRKILNEKVVDKVGFIVAVEVAGRNPGDDPTLYGPLK